MTSDASDFDWSQFLSIAQSLCGLPFTGPAPRLEAFQRVAVSRAYYAAFAVARNYLRDVDSISLAPNDNVHRAVARGFLSSTDLGRVGVGTQLTRLRVARNQCDYDDQVPGLAALTEDSLHRAAEVLEELGRL